MRSSTAVGVGLPVSIVLASCAQIAGVDFDGYGPRPEAVGAQARGAGGKGATSGRGAASGSGASGGGGASSSSGASTGSGGAAGFCNIACGSPGSGGASPLVTGLTGDVDVTGLAAANGGVYIAHNADDSNCGGILHVQINPCNLSW